MVVRTAPEEYFQYQNNNVYIPKWVPLLLGMALIGAFVIAGYALSKVR